VIPQKCAGYTKPQNISGVTAEEEVAVAVAIALSLAVIAVVAHVCINIV